MVYKQQRIDQLSSWAWSISLQIVCHTLRMCISIFVGQFRKSCQFAAKRPAQHISWSQFFENQCVLFRDLCAINIYINVNSFQDINIFYDYFFWLSSSISIIRKISIGQVFVPFKSSTIVSVWKSWQVCGSCIRQHLGKAVEERQRVLVVQLHPHPGPRGAPHKPSTAVHIKLFTYVCVWME